MSICVCPVVGIDSQQQKEFVNKFLEQVGVEWSLQDVKFMYKNGNSIEDISEVVPFRGGPCSRTIRCCSECTRRCKHRCIQDCLTRLYMWRTTFYSTTAIEREKLPLNIRMISVQKFYDWEQLSWSVGEILSKVTNPELKGYSSYEHPYKLNYAPRFETDLMGRKLVDPDTGEYHIVQWPDSGLCPYCIPDSVYDGRVLNKIQRRG